MDTMESRIEEVEYMMTLFIYTIGVVCFITYFIAFG
jgi:hypothetical protein